MNFPYFLLWACSICIIRKITLKKSYNIAFLSSFFNWSGVDTHDSVASGGPLRRTFFLNSAEIQLGHTEQASCVQCCHLRPTCPACPPPYLVIKSCPREHHGHLIGPLRLVLPLTHLVVPEVQTTGVTHQTVRKLPPDLREKHIQFRQRANPVLHHPNGTEGLPEPDPHQLRLEWASEEVFRNGYSTNIRRYVWALISSKSSYHCWAILSHVVITHLFGTK